MNTKKETIVGLDIGSAKIATVIGVKKETGIDIIGVGTAPSAGLRKGIIVDLEETISAISESLEKAERMAGTIVETAVVGIGGAHIESQNSKGVIAVSRPDGEITEEDVARAIDAAKAVTIPANREVIHVIPRIYTVDGQEGIKEPVGMTGIRLEVEAHVISASTPVIKNLEKAVWQAGISISDLVFLGLAESELFLNKQQREMGVVLVDIGAATTTMTVFEEGDILYSTVLPVGSNHITNDIAIGLRIAWPLAEKLKLKFGQAVSEGIRESEKIDLAKFDKMETQKVAKSYLAEIIEARLVEIFNLVQDELKEINREGTLPAGVVLVGGGSKIPKIVELAKETLKLPVELGKMEVEFGGFSDKIKDPAMAGAVSLMHWGAKYGTIRAKSVPAMASAKSAFDKIKNLIERLTK